MIKEFSVHCDTFKQYEELKLQMEAIGYTYCTAFTEFTRELTKTCNCFYFANGFNGGITPNAFALSGTSKPTYKYPQDKKEILYFAKANLGSSLQLTLKELVDIAARNYGISRDLIIIDHDK